MTKAITQAEWAEARRSAMEILPELMAEGGLPHVLLGYQAKTIAKLESSTCQVLFIEKSRRIGLTWGFAAYAALRAGRTKAAGGMDVMYISYSQEMTREFIDACGMWAKAFSQAAASVEEFLFDDGDAEGDRSIQAFRIRFASGFEVLALSSAPRTLRGKQGVVMIDEAAFVDSLPELLKAALAFLMWGGQVVVCSTHDGVENEFNKQIQEILAGRSKYDHLRIDFDDALRDGLYQRICLVTNKVWSPEAEATWRQQIIDFYGDGADEELFCVPTMGSGSWLSAQLIEARMTESPQAAPIIRIELPSDFLHRSRLERTLLMLPHVSAVQAAVSVLDRERMHAFGFDFARVADLSVGSLLSIDRLLKRRSALTLEMRNVPGDEQKLLVGMILKGAPRLVGAAFDATGMGWTVAEDMGRTFGFRENNGLVDPIKFSADWYRYNMPPLKAAFEDDTIAITKDDEHLSDLRLVKVVAGVPMIPAIRTGQGSKKRHGDYAVALALAHFASRHQWSEVEYVPVSEISKLLADDDEDFSYGRKHW